MLVQTMNAITCALPEPPRRRRGRDPLAKPGDRPAAAAEQPALGLHPGRAAPADRRRGAPTSTTTTTGSRSLGKRGAAGARRRQPLAVPGGVPQPAAPSARSSTRRTTTRRSIADAFPVLNALKDVHLLLTAGRAQPVRRPALDGAPRDADAAVDPRAAGVPRVPAHADHGRLPRGRGWTASTR